MSALHTDIGIARKAKLKPIEEIADRLGVPRRHLELFGPHKAKVRLEILEDDAERKRGKYVAVTAITPLPLGEGKTVTTIGLAQGLSRLGENAVCTLRQPSLGPVFGVKGGAAGGGHAQVVPMQDINLHLTGDFHAVGSAHNLLAAVIDNHLYHGNRLGIEPSTVTWRRVVDMNDRALRSLTVHEGTPIERETGFDITAASEVMAILALATSYPDMRQRLDRILVARTRKGRPVRAEHFRCAGAMALLLRDAMKPNLLQTTENTPAFIHTGPFANIAHGNCSVLADRIALSLADYVVTECGFGADLGYEKFCDIKCRTGGLEPDAAVLVATVRGLKAHSGRFRVAPGLPLPEELFREDVEAVAEGAANLEHHVECVRKSGVPVVVAVNRFQTDTGKEIEAVVAAAKKAGAAATEVCEAHARGGAGAQGLGEAVRRACREKPSLRYYYDVKAPIRKKIEAIAVGVYGADGVDYAEQAEARIDRFEKWGFGELPVCMAKTQLSLTHDAKIKGRPKGFRVPVRDARVSAGAGFIYPLCGAIMTMPGMPSKPGAEKMDIDGRGNIIGLR